MDFLENGEEEYKFTPEGRYIVNYSQVIINATCADLDLIRALMDHARTEIDNGDLVQVLTYWTPAVDQWSLYFPSRKQMPAALQAFTDFIKSQ